MHYHIPSRPGWHHDTCLPILQSALASAQEEVAIAQAAAAEAQARAQQLSQNVRREEDKKKVSRQVGLTVSRTASAY
jgi:hypothetical protein